MQPQKKAIIISLVVGILLMLAKFTAYFMTSSNAILTDAVESIVNVLASAFAFYSIYLAAQPRDHNHPYGHGKVEFFSVFIEGILILIAGLMIVFKSGYNLIYPHAIGMLLSGSAIIGITGVVNCIVGFYLVKQGKILKSMTLEADGKHLLTDAVTSFGLMMGLLIIYFTKIDWLDSLLSIVLGIFVVYSGYKLVRKSVGGLMDESDEKLLEQVVSILNENRNDEWIDVHNLRTQQYGPELHIDCHLTLPYYFDLNRVHEEVSKFDALINEKAQVTTEFFIHADPCLPQCCHYCRMKDCPVRQEPKSKDIVWTLSNTTKNLKHFHESI